MRIQGLKFLQQLLIDDDDDDEKRITDEGFVMPRALPTGAALIVESVESIRV